MEEAKADWKKGWAWAKYDPSETSPEKLVKAVNENTAFEAKLAEKDKEGGSRRRDVAERPVALLLKICALERSHYSAPTSTS